MVVSCAAYGCKNRWSRQTDRRYHRFPLNNPQLLQRWLIAVRRAEFHPTRASFLCSDHFTDDCYRSDTKHFLKEDAVPSIFCFTPQSQKRKATMPKNELPSDYPGDPYSEYEPLSPTSESIVRALNSIGVVDGSDSQPNEKKEPDKSILTRPVPLQIIEHLYHSQQARKLKPKRKSRIILNNKNCSHSTVTASSSTRTVHGSHSRPNKVKESDGLVLTREVPLRLMKLLDSPQTVQMLNCKRTSPTSLNNTNSAYSTTTASTSTATIHESYSLSNKRIKPDNISLTRNVSLPIKRHLTYPQGVWRLKYKRASPANCVEGKNFPEATVTVSTSSDKIHGRHKEIETHDTVLTRDASLPVIQHLNNPQEIIGAETMGAVLACDAKLPVNEHFKRPQGTTGVEAYDADLTCDESLPVFQHLNNPQEIIGAETVGIVLTCDAKLPINEHLKRPQETTGAETYHADLTCDESLPVIQHLNNPQETVLAETVGVVLTCDAKLPIIEHLKSPQENILAETESVVLTCNAKLPINEHLKNPQETTGVETHDTDLICDETLPINQHLSNLQETPDEVLTHDKSLPINQHLSHPLEISGIKTHHIVLTRDASLPVIQHLNNPQETPDEDLTHDESLPINQHLSHPLEISGIKTHHTGLTRNTPLPVIQHLNNPQETAGIEKNDAILTREESLPVNQHLNHVQETADVETHNTSLPENQPLNRAEKTSNDACEEFGKHVATKLRELPNQQRIMCEKVINDALSKAKQGILTPKHVLCKIKPSYYNYRYKASLLAREIKSLSQHMADSEEYSE